jgi:hypothetical protein
MLRLVNQAAGVDRLDYHLDQELEHLARIADGPDFAEGLEAFFARRPPRFRGAGGLHALDRQLNGTHDAPMLLASWRRSIRGETSSFQILVYGTPPDAPCVHSWPAR